MAVTTVTTRMAGAINYTVVTDTSADWPSVANSTYFYDKADKLVHYKDGAGAIQEIFSAAGGLTEFTEAETTAAPNATVPVNSLTPVTATTNADIAIVPKGNGAVLAAIPDNTTTGGNKRGIGAVDLQMSRTAANQVASGQYSVVAGSRSNANDYSIAIGLVNSVNSNISASIGSGNTHAVGALYSHSVGRDNVVSAAATNSFVAGFGNTISNDRTTSLGASNTASGSAAVALGQQTTASGANSTSGGYLTTASGTQSVAIGGAYTLASNTWAVAIGANVTASGVGSVALGSSNTRATGDYSFAAGYNNFASAQGSFALGIGSTASGFRSGAMGSDGHTFGIAARLVWSGQQQGVAGDTQSSKFILQKRTTTNTATTLTADSATAGTANQVILSNNSAYRFKGTIIGKQQGSINAAAWDVDGIIVRGPVAAFTVLQVGNVTLVQNTPAWGTPTLAADTTNGGLQVQVTGAAATNIQWTAVIETIEVIYA